MTREEKINYASKDYVNYLLDKQEYHNEIYTEYDILEAFEKGAMFADNNPDLSALWHDVSEKPEEGELIVCINEYEKLYIGNIRIESENENSWYSKAAVWNDEHLQCYWCFVDKWAYVNDLMPKGGENE